MTKSIDKLLLWKQRESLEIARLYEVKGYQVYCTRFTNSKIDPATLDDRYRQGPDGKWYFFGITKGGWEG